MRDLLPCPFCGGEVKLHPTYDTDTDKANGYFVMCRNKNCMALPEAAEYPAEVEDIKAWNTRAEQTCHDVNEDDHDFTCSECGASMYILVNDCWTMIGRRGLCDDVIERPNYCPNCGARVLSDNAQ